MRGMLYENRWEYSVPSCELFQSYFSRPRDDGIEGRLATGRSYDVRNESSPRELSLESSPG